MFASAALLLLGIERFLYGYIYHFPQSFKRLCNGPLKPLLDYDGGVYWLVAKHLGVLIKVFQFGVVGYDLVTRWTTFVILEQPVKLVVGLAIAGLGQLLNGATFKAIGAQGVYYGGQLGCPVPWCSGFPYNIGVGDPQYWGVALSVWGFYILVAPTDASLLSRHLVVPLLETFWYLASMKLLEHTQNGGQVLKLLGLKDGKGEEK